MDVAKKHQDRIKVIKENIEGAYAYFKPNYDRYNEFRKFVFDTSISEDEKNLLQDLKKPPLEFNINEAYLSRLRGEFSKQEPSVEVMSDDEVSVDGSVIQVVEGYLRHTFTDANNDGLEYEVYTDLLSGGFSAIKVWTDYAHEMSFNQIMKVGRVFDPTMTGFDHLARLPHKGDGRFCFELFPQSKEEFLRNYPDKDISMLKFSRSTSGGFNWSYQSEKEEIVILCDYYEKKKKKIKILKLADDQILTRDEYEEFIDKWMKSGTIQQPPTIVEERTTERVIICRYRLIENEILEYVETDFKMLPIVFVDGNSVLLRNGKNASVQQMTRPYIYHAKGAQKLKNFAGQTWANELENMIQHKFKVAKESLPQEAAYLAAYDNVQQATTLVYNAFQDNNPDAPIPPPMEIARVGAPPEMMAAFTMTDQLFQTILGSYDASLGINNNQLSGVAIVEGATQSNSAAMPYVVGFLQGLNQVANILVDLIPKYLKTPRTIPVVGMNGKRDYQIINDPNNPKSISLDYGENALRVKVKAGVNFAIQKSRALQQMISLMQASELFANFMNTEGLDVLLDNMEFRGVDIVKQKADMWMKKMKMQQVQQQQMQMQQAQQAAKMPNPVVMKMQMEQQKLQMEQQKLAQDSKDSAVDAILRAKQIEIDKEDNRIAAMKIHADLIKDKDQLSMQKMRDKRDNLLNTHDSILKEVDMHHKHEMELNRNDS